MKPVKVLAVRRTIDHRVVMHFTEDSNGVITIVRVTPDMGPLPNSKSLAGKNYDNVSAARAAVREAMKATNDQELTVPKLTLNPQRIAEYLQSVDGFLFDIGKRAMDMHITALPKIRIRKNYRKSGESHVVASADGYEFDFGSVNWDNFEVI